ncbi:hypothetical protein LX16_5070 [Stackebrandtia albiflava]|uniref:Uncharacterized protein n=1 Tax=Stackebrandtia albiflava TaxID=406432 RepID=A0A562UPQ3_9ACTN|nr:hypothetical protein [Stackebrandtia albiflava]TWJ07584.1 hypothetical protein LX16_5070 [Stackebrandtia albiflava]
MAYPPQGYPPRHGHPQAPPPQGYPPPQYGYPHQGYTGQPVHGHPQQHGYAPPPQQPPPAKRRGGGFRIILTIVILAGAGWFGVQVWNAERPELGDCLSSMEGDIYGGMPVVSCDDPAARFEVVAYTSSGSASDARASICEGHPDGQSHVETRKRGRLSWAICAVPV